MKPITISAALALVLLSASTLEARRVAMAQIAPEVFHRTYRAPPTAALKGSDLAFNLQTDANDETDPVTAAYHFVQEYLTPSDFYVHSSYMDKHTGVTHVYFRQVVYGLEVANADINVNVDADLRVISWGDSFYKGQKAAINAKEQQELDRLRLELEIATGRNDAEHVDVVDDVVEKQEEQEKQENNDDDDDDDDDDEEDDEEKEREKEKEDEDEEDEEDEEHGFIDKLETVVETVAEVFADNINQIVLGAKPQKKTNGFSKRSGCGHTDRPTMIDYAVKDQSAPVITPIDALRSFAAFVNPVGLMDVKEATLVPVDSFHAPQSGPYPPIATIENTTFAISPIPVRQVLVQTDKGELALVWDLQIEMQDNWFHTHVDAHTGDIISLIDWVSDATYNVYPLGLNDPSDGSRELLEDPYDKVASPLGWHNFPAGPFQNSTKTMGNNVYAHENTDGQDGWRNNFRPDGGENLAFDFPLDPETMEPKEYLEGAIVNLFYWNNIMHDLFYRYGFDEASGNFQEHNFGRQGKDDDAVIANAQDGSGYNNANFATPPDGQNGKMRMYIWDASSPMRDGDLEAGIIIHEYSHGISIRLTGGPANSDCLLFGESGGMGEGWGDFFATIFRMKPNMTRKQEFGMGNWANGGEGIRKYRYSTSKKSNPETFGTMNKPSYFEPHASGAVWAEMLYEVYWNLVDKNGFTTQWFPPTPSKHDESEPEESDKKDKKKKKKDPALDHILSYGNTLALQLVVDGMKLQPCRPSFIDARDAILQADEILTNGDNRCAIWAGFAKRGLGLGAKTQFFFKMQSFKVPSDC